MLAVVLYTAGPVAQFLVWKNPKRVYSVGKTLCTILIFVSGVRVRIIGKRPPKNKQYVLVANHSSIWDEAGMTLAMGEEPYTIIFAEEIKRVPFIGGMLRKAAIPVDRDDPNSRTIAADKAMEEVRNGKNYAAYAEGKRLRVEDFNKGIIMYKFKLSAFKIACKFELDVYPVVFAFPYLYKPRSGQWWVSPREIKMICCDPISTKGKDPKEVAEETYVLMEATLRKELIKMGILN